MIAPTSKRPASAIVLLALAGLTAAVAADQPRVAFITSVTGNGNLSSWQDAGGATGLAAGDAICVARATAAALANPQNFVAWLSDANDDAWCRIHGLNGKRASNCGQQSLPAAAGPWVRTDGQPFAESIEQIVPPFNRILLPLRFDEFGNKLAPNLGLWTGTFTQGSVSFLGETCSNWTFGSSGLGSRGLSGETAGGWTATGGIGCSSPTQRLICMEREAGPPLPERSVEGLIVFLSTSSGNGNLSTWPNAGTAVGLAAGDAVCQAEALSAGLPEPGSFKAWLSNDEINAIDRLVGRGPWSRLDGIPVAANRAELVSGELFAPISLQPDGNHNFRTPWTGTNAFGLSAGSNCAGWTLGDVATDGTKGKANSVSADWASWALGQDQCGLVRQLYCFQDLIVDEVFADRFESPTN